MAVGPTTIVGEVKAWAGDCPTMTGVQEPSPGYLLCNGTAVNRTTYDDLFAIIGTTFGVGDGSTTFNLPNFQGKLIMGATSATAGVAGGRGYSAGSLTHGHQVDIANHSHTVNSHTHSIPSHTHNIGAHAHTINAHNHFYSVATGPSDSTLIRTGGNNSPPAAHTHGASGFTAAPAVNTSNSGTFVSAGSGTLTTASSSPGTSSNGAQTLAAGSGVSIIDHTPPYQIFNFLIKY
jgi:microcystin-dependent protein